MPFKYKNRLIVKQKRTKHLAIVQRNLEQDYDPEVVALSNRSKYDSYADRRSEAAETSVGKFPSSRASMFSLTCSAVRTEAQLL